MSTHGKQQFRHLARWRCHFITLVCVWWLAALVCCAPCVYASVNASSTDFVALYRALDTNTTSSTDGVSRLELADADIPAEIQNRLDPFTLDFSELPGLLQRALLWDTGYSLAGNSSSLAQIFTLCGSTMADLALSRKAFETTGCSIKNCSGTSTATNSSKALLGLSYATQCRADQLVAAAKCSTTSITSESRLPLWTAEATGTLTTNATTMPQIRMQRHRWTDATLKQEVHVFAIHSEPAAAASGDATTTDATVCKSKPSQLPVMPVVPCVPYKPVDTRWCRPTYSSTMDDWLREAATEIHSKKKTQIDDASELDLRNRNSTRVVEKDTNGVTIDKNFTFDGTSSDLAQQLYRRFVAGDQAAAMALDMPLPLEIRQRLNDVSLEFNELPALLQRALVWDAGFAMGDGNTLAAIYVPCGSSMAEIALSRKTFNLAGCKEHNCTDERSGATFSRSTDTCTGDQIAAASRCATTDMNTPVHVSVWADGGHDDLVPDANILRHTWEDRSKSYLIYGIHVVRDQVAQSKCPERGAMVIPCLPYTAVSASGRWCRPKPGALVTSWLRYTAKGKQFNLVLLLPILLSVALIVSGVLFCFRHRSWWQRSDAKPWQLDPQLSHTTCGSVTQRNGTEDDGFEFVADAHDHSRSSSTHSHSHHDERSSIESFAAAMSSNSVLDTLVNNHLLASHRVDLSALRFDRMIAKGGHGEVWLCRWQESDVAVKRLLRTRKNRFEDIEAFTREIALTASMDHPNIVQFLGVAWNSLQNLCMVTEYMANGDLLEYLRRANSHYTWTVDKIRIACGVACALDYIHAREPATIHRDLKSKNILLSEDFHAKLIDFGVSRSQLGDAMTKGVGTPYWTAPEILQGQPYTEKADMFSFGIVLCELDTEDAPYHDRRTSDGKPEFTPLQILQHVVSGDLRPTISESCPLAVAELARTCLQRDPSERPSASQALEMLQRCDELDGTMAILEDLRLHISRRDMAYHL